MDLGRAAACAKITTTVAPVCVWGEGGGGGGVRGEERSCEGVSQDGMCQNHHCCGICVRVGGRGEGW